MLELFCNNTKEDKYDFKYHTKEIMDFEDFEGYKKIPNEKHIKVQEIYEVLEKYKENIGELSYIIDLENSDILIKIEGKYDAKIYLKNDEIIIERIIEKGHLDDSKNAFENGKSIALAHADRVIEQIYDLLKDYLEDGVIKEHITKAQKVLKLSQDSEVKALTSILIADNFVVTDYNDERKVLYTVKQSVITNSYVVNNVESKREAFSLKYQKEKTNKFTISKPPFEIVELHKVEDSVKMVFNGTINRKQLKISADYSENHYLIELDEIVIGAVDCLDAALKRNYRLEINDLKYEEIVIAVAIMSDYISLVQNKGL